MQRQKDKGSMKDLKSVSDVRAKADQYSSSNEQVKMVKRAILQELNTHLISIKPQVLHRKAETEAHKRKVQISGNASKSEKEKVYSKDLKNATKRITEPTVSRIPRLDNRTLHKMKSVRVSTPAKSAPARVPGYDWDRNGRIAELRIRFLARKYSFIWGKKTFGRVLPHHARRHYEQKLMREAFHTLENLWWNSRKGWKLNIRAEYHDRYRIWKNFFRDWRLFVVHQKEKKVQNKLASRFDEINCLGKAFNSMKLYSLSRKDKKIKYQEAIEFHTLSMSRLAFRKWTAVFANALMNKEMENQALGFWAYNVKLRALQKWILVKKLKDIENEKTKIAEMHFRRTITKKCLESFSAYLMVRKRKQRIQDFASYHYNKNLKKRSIQTWYMQLQHWLEIQNMEQRINFMARKFKTRIYFMRWIQYIEDLKFQRIRMAEATVYHGRSIKLKCLNALNYAAKQRRLKITRNVQAAEFHSNKVLSRHWNRWLLRCDHSEELKMYPLTKMARSFYRKNRLKESIARWWQYVMWRRQRKSMYAKAEKHYENVAIPKYFWKLLDYTEYRKWKAEKRNLAEDFNRELRHARVFYTWLKKCRLQQNFRMLERMAILQNEETCKRKALLRWKARTTSVLREKDKEELARVHLVHHLKKKYFDFLKNNVIEENTRRALNTIAFQHERKKKLFVVFDSWIKFTKNRKHKRMKLESANRHFQRKLLLKYFDVVKVYVQQRRIVNNEAFRREKIHNESLLRFLLKRWHDNVSEAIDEKFKLTLATEFWCQNTQQKVFIAWRDFAVVSNHERQSKKSAFEKISVQMEKGKLRRAFHALRCHVQISRQKKISQAKAMAFYEHNAKRKYLFAWRVFVALSFRKMLLQRQSAIFFTKRKMKCTLEKWKSQYKEAIQESNKCNVVMWWWSQNLQRKALYAWLEYVKINQENKKRISQALEIRRDWMLQNCIRRWFEFSADMMVFRKKVAEARQIEGSIRLQEKVRKFALFWYEKTKRRRKRGSSPQKLDFQPQISSQQIGGISNGLGMPDSFQRYSGSICQSADILEFPKTNNRMMPRKPEYLKESFDLNQLLESISADMKNSKIHCSDESQPRLPAPNPEMRSRMQIHPLNRYKADGSIDFLASSEDESRVEHTNLDKSQVQQRKSLGKLNEPELETSIVLMPPSLFKKSSSTVGVTELPESKLGRKVAFRDDIKKQSRKLLPSADSSNWNHFSNGDTLRDTNPHIIGKVLEKSEDAMNISVSNSSDEDLNQQGHTPMKYEDDDANISSDSNDSSDSSSSDTENEDDNILEEIAAINEKLKRFKTQQDRYRDLMSRHMHLTQWIDSEKHRKSYSEIANDVDYQEAVLLLSEVDNEMKNLSDELQRKKPLIAQMARTVDALTDKMYGS